MTRRLSVLGLMRPFMDSRVYSRLYSRLYSSMYPVPLHDLFDRLVDGQRRGIEQHRALRGLKRRGSAVAVACIALAQIPE